MDVEPVGNKSDYKGNSFRLSVLSRRNYEKILNLLMTDQAAESRFCLATP